MKYFRGKILIILSIVWCSVILCGCKEIFVTPTDPYEQIELSKDELQPGVFYIKDGTKFIKVWNPDKRELLGNAMDKKTLLLFLHEDYKAVPTLYKNEILAIASKDISISIPKLIRFKEIGYNTGLYGLTENPDGSLSGTLENNIYNNSDMYKKMKLSSPSNQFRLVGLNNEKINPNMFTDSAAKSFNCMEKNKEYTFEFYAGTYYSNLTVLADIFMLESFELFELSHPENTKHGYLSFSMPENVKSGWYYLEGYGLFKYIDCEKGYVSDDINMNEPVYETEKEKIMVYSQKYSTSLDTRKTNISFEFYYNLNDALLEEIYGIIYSPDGTEYQLKIDEEKNLLYCNLQEAMAGKWEIYIHPKTLEISKMEIVPNNLSSDITEEEVTLSIEMEKTNLLINVPYQGEGEIYSIMIGPDNEMYEFTTDYKEKNMYYLAAYLAAGEYTLKIYHFADTEVGTPLMIENSKVETEIISITE